MVTYLFYVHNRVLRASPSADINSAHIKHNFGEDKSFHTSNVGYLINDAKLSVKSHEYNSMIFLCLCCDMAPGNTAAMNYTNMLRKMVYR